MSLKPVYHCSQCKKITHELGELLFVEEGVQRGFCSEGCIETYFGPIIEHYEKQEKQIRKRAGLEDEPCLKYVGQPSYMEMTLSRPKQIWRLENELKEEVFAFISEFKERETQFQKTFYFIILCTVFDRRPAFIFSVTTTKDLKVLKAYQIGEPIQDPTSFLKPLDTGGLAEEGSSSPTDVHPEAIQGLEQKKGQILAQQLELRSEADIPFDQFNLYDQFFDPTIEDPDEVYRWHDDSGDVLMTYIKAHNQGQTSFFYFVIMLRIDPKWVVQPEQNKEVLVPVLSFPSVDGEISDFYRKGDLLAGVTKN